MHRWFLRQNCDVLRVALAKNFGPGRLEIVFQLKVLELTLNFWQTGCWLFLRNLSVLTVKIDVICRCRRNFRFLVRCFWVFSGFLFAAPNLRDLFFVGLEETAVFTSSFSQLLSAKIEKSLQTRGAAKKRTEVPSAKKELPLFRQNFSVSLVRFKSANFLACFEGTSVFRRLLSLLQTCTFFKLLEVHAKLSSQRPDHNGVLLHQRRNLIWGRWVKLSESFSRYFYSSSTFPP